MSINPVAVFPVNRKSRPKVAVLLNTNARSVTSRVIRSIQQVVPPDDLYISDSFEQAARITNEVVNKGYDTVLTGGGDGTFVGFLNMMRDIDPGFISDGNTLKALAPQPLPKFGVLRLGTGNALAGMTGSSPLLGGGVLEDILNVRAGRASNTRYIDLVEADGIAAPFAGFGYDALVLNNYIKFKKMLAGTPLKNLGEGISGYMLSLYLLTVPEALMKKFPDVEVRNEGAPVRRLGYDGLPVGPEIPTGALLYKGPANFVAAGTCPCYGFGFRVFPFAESKPGKMQLRVASTGAAKVLMNLPTIWKGKWKSPTFHDFMVEKVNIKCQSPMPLQIGGDAKGFKDEITLKVSDTPVEFLDFRKSR